MLLITVSHDSVPVKSYIVFINYRLAPHPQALPFGEGAPVGGGRGAVQCFVFLFHAAKTHCGNTSSVTAAPCHLPQWGRLSFVRKLQFFSLSSRAGRGVQTLEKNSKSISKKTISLFTFTTLCVTMYLVKIGTSCGNIHISPWHISM